MGAPQPMIGPCFTVTCVDVGEPPEIPYRGLLEALDTIVAGEVLVLPTGRSARAAVWGELLTTACQARGVAGVVTDGLARDIARVRATDFPVYACGTLPVDINGRLEIVGMREPVEIDGVVIAQGDLIVADVDGVVVVPASLEADVARAVDAKARAESLFRDAVEAGVAPSVAFDRYRVL